MKAGNEQTVLDLALKAHGNIDRVFEIAEDNDISVTDDLTSGHDYTVNVPDELTNDQKRDILHYARNDIEPASGDAITEAAIILEGIGYWYIGIDFDFEVS